MTFRSPAEVTAYLAERRAQLLKEIVAIETLARARLATVLSKGGDVGSDVYWNALTTALTLMKHHEKGLELRDDYGDQEPDD